MDKKSKIFFAVFFLLIVLSVGATYYRYVVAHDYMIQAELDCDPYTESCFVYVCDPEADEECTGDPIEDTSYYKLIDRNAKNIPLCDPADENCTALVCEEGEVDCSYTLCDPETAEEGEVCNDPVVYTAENPIEEETDEAVDEEGATTLTEDEESIPATEGEETANETVEGEETTETPANANETEPVSTEASITPAVSETIIIP